MEIKLLTKFPTFKKRFRKGGIHTSPELFWELLLFMAFSIILASCVFGFFLFIQIDKGSMAEQVDTNTGTQTINSERINKVLEHFSTRAEKSTQIINSPSPIIDPSL